MRLLPRSVSHFLSLFQRPDGDYTGNLKYGIKKINITYDVKGAIQSVELWTDDLDCKYENSTGEYTVNKI